MQVVGKEVILALPGLFRLGWQVSGWCGGSVHHHLQSWRWLLAQRETRRALYLVPGHTNWSGLPCVIAQAPSRDHISTRRQVQAHATPSRRCHPSERPDCEGYSCRAAVVQLHRAAEAPRVQEEGMRTLPTAFRSAPTVAAAPSAAFWPKNSASRPTVPGAGRSTSVTNSQCRRDAGRCDPSSNGTDARHDHVRPACLMLSWLMVH